MEMCPAGRESPGCWPRRHATSKCRYRAARSSRPTATSRGRSRGACSRRPGGWPARTARPCRTRKPARWPAWYLVSCCLATASQPGWRHGRRHPRPAHQGRSHCRRHPVRHSPGTAGL